MTESSKPEAPADAELAFSEALRLHKTGSLAEAEAIYLEILDRNPQHVNAHHFLGLCRMQRGELDEALRSFDHSLRLAPEYPAALNNRATVYRKLHRLDEAAGDYRRLVALNPGHLPAYFSLAGILLELGRAQEALAVYGQILTIAPDRTDAWINSGNLLRQFNRRAEALACYDRALAIEPQAADLLSNRATVLFELERFEEAASGYERVLAVAPDTPEVEGQALFARMQVCDWRDFDRRCARILAGIAQGRNVILPFSLLAIEASAEQQLQCATMHAAAEFPPDPSPLAESVRYGHERIRIGYFSADFHNHATAHLMTGLLERHDRARFEIFGFSYGPATGDRWRQRLGRAFDRLIDVGGWTDRQVAASARELEIDIAVDLKGYTKDSRSGIFAFRPAPVQVSYLGYPGTLGAAYIDYIVADDTVIPPEQRKSYSECVASLPYSYQVNDSTKAIAGRQFSRTELGLPESAMVFCCFNNNYKITPDVFDIWMRLLLEVEGSVLWLLAGNDSARRNLGREAERRGVRPERLVFAPRMELSEHLARHRQADLFLDTFHCNAHTTASDALWAGLPVLTCPGKPFAARVAASLLKAMGLPELIVSDPQAYLAMALELAKDRERLGRIRRDLAAKRLSEPLFDTVRTTRYLEKAFLAMWQRHEAGLAPESFAVSGD